MPWLNDPAARRQSNQTYGPEYRANRRLAAKRAGGRCERCGKRSALTCDHITPTSATNGIPNHSLANLQMLCPPCHARKTAQEGGGWRAKAQVSDPQPTPRTTW